MVNEFNFSDRLKNLSGNAIREIFKLLSRPEIVSFAGGLPAPECIPAQKIAEYCSEILQSSDNIKVLQYGATEGYQPLRTLVPSYLQRMGIQGLNTDNVLIVSGGQQGIDLTMKSFVNKGDVVLTENPTYLAVLHIIKTYEAQAVGVGSDEEGVDLQQLESAIKKHKPKVFYTVPNFQNPTGTTMSYDRRRDVAALCAKYGVIVLEDDPYRELRYSGSPLPAIKSFDSAGNVIYLCSFSKIVSPSLRVGVVAADPLIVRRMTIGKQASDVQTATLPQAIIERFISTGEIYKTIENAIPVYRKKLAAMSGAMDKYGLSQKLSYTVPEGGLFLWATLKDESVDTSKLLLKAVENDVAFVGGRDFFPDGSGANTMRLNFSGSSEESIYNGIERLSQIL